MITAAMFDKTFTPAASTLISRAAAWLAEASCVCLCNLPGPLRRARSCLFLLLAQLTASWLVMEAYGSGGKTLKKKPWPVGGWREQWGRFPSLDLTWPRLLWTAGNSSPSVWMTSVCSSLLSDIVAPMYCLSALVKSSPSLGDTCPSLVSHPAQQDTTLISSNFRIWWTFC